MAKFIHVPSSMEYVTINVDHIIFYELSQPDFKGGGGGTRICLTGDKFVETDLEPRELSLAIEEAIGHNITTATRKP